MTQPTASMYLIITVKEISRDKILACKYIAISFDTEHAVLQISMSIVNKGAAMVSQAK